MPDIELLDLWNRRDWTQVRGGQPMSSVDSKTELGGESGGLTQRLRWRRIVRMIRVLARVKLDRTGADSARHRHRGRIGPDEQARPDSSLAQFGHRALHALSVGDHIEATFGCYLLATLGNERHLIRMDGDCDGDHLVGAGKFQIEVAANRGAQTSDVRILDVPAILPQVRSDPIGADRLADHGGLDRIRLIAAPRLSKCRDVVNIHIKALVACSHIRPEYNFFTMKKLLLAFVVVGAVACHTAPPSTSTLDNSPGAKSSIGAVERFFAAVHAQDLQAMSLVWGTSRGSARDNMARVELEKREVILQCYFNYDAFRVLGESPTSEIRRMVRVQLERGGRTRTPVIYTVIGPNGRWYVENLDIAAVKDFCAMAPVSP